MASYCASVSGADASDSGDSLPFGGLGLLKEISKCWVGQGSVAAASCDSIVAPIAIKGRSGVKNLVGARAVTVLPSQSRRTRRQSLTSHRPRSQHRRWWWPVHEQDRYCTSIHKPSPLVAGRRSNVMHRNEPVIPALCLTVCMTFRVQAVGRTAFFPPDAIWLCSAHRRCRHDEFT